MSSHVEKALREEEHAGLELASRVKLAGLAVVAVWVTIENDFPEVWFFLPMFAAMALAAAAPPWLLRRGLWGRWPAYAIPALEIALFVAFAMAPNPLDEFSIRGPRRLQIGNEVYLFVLLAVSVFSYSPRLVLWTGAAGAIAWLVTTILILADQLASTAGISHEAWSALGRLGRVTVLLLVTASGLAATVQRSRRLVERTVAAERARLNLGRYFSPNMVEELSSSDVPLDRPTSLDAAVLFVDIVGFTALAENRTPAQTIELLRAFHSRVQDCVFSCSGTLDKSIGDGVMATFGTPRPSRSDAANALRCARAIAESLEAWTVERERLGTEPIRVGIGAHYGVVVIGDIGDSQRLERAVLGDTVNVASRLERASRDLGCTVVVSEDLVAAARREASELESFLSQWSAPQAQSIRGRAEPITVRTWTVGVAPIGA